MYFTHQPRIYEQFARFLSYVALTALLFAALELFSGALLGYAALVMVGASMIPFALGLLLARRIMRRSAEVGGAVAALAFLLTPLVFVAALPFLLPVGVFFVIAACSLPMVFGSRRLFLGVAVASICTSLLLALVNLSPPLLPQPEPWVVTAFLLSNLPVCASLMALLFFFIWQHARAGIAEVERSNAELSSLQSSLAAQVVERTAALAAALDEVRSQAEAQSALLAENSRQRGMIRAVSVPVLPISVGTLVIPLVGLLDAERLDTLLGRTLEAIAARPTRRIVLDITGVPVIDEQVAQGLLRVPQAARLLGAEVVLVGISPEVAQTVVGLGLDFAGIHTASTLADAVGGLERAVA